MPANGIYSKSTGVWSVKKVSPSVLSSQLSFPEAVPCVSFQRSFVCLRAVRTQARACHGMVACFFHPVIPLRQRSVDAAYTPQFCWLRNVPLYACTTVYLTGPLPMALMRFFIFCRFRQCGSALHFANMILSGGIAEPWGMCQRVKTQISL